MNKLHECYVYIKDKTSKDAKKYLLSKKPRCIVCDEPSNIRCKETEYDIVCNNAICTKCTCPCCVLL